MATSTHNAPMDAATRNILIFGTTGLKGSKSIAAHMRVLDEASRAHLNEAAHDNNND